MKRIVLVYGLIAGAIVSAMMAVSIFLLHDHMDMEQSMMIGYASMLVAFALIFVGVKSYRDNQNGGQISFGKAFTIGLWITLIASTVYVAVWAVEYNFFVPDFMEKYTATMVNKAKADGLSASELAAKVKEMEQAREWYKNPLFFTLMTYAEILPVGLVVSLITALFLKRKHAQTATA